jgi:hypothetical protein
VSRSARRTATALLFAISAWASLADGANSSAGSAERFNGVWLIEKAPQTLTTVDGKPAPLRPEARAEYEKRLAARHKGDLSFDRASWCAAAGVPRLMLEPHPFEILVNPRQVAFLYEWNRWARLIDMTGHDLQPYYPLAFGTANGRFDGDRLVVVTRGLMSQTFLDRSGLPHSEDLVLTETFRLKSAGVLENRIRIDDPKTYTSAWEAVVTYRRQPGARLKEDVCLDRIKQGKPAI